MPFTPVAPASPPPPAVAPAAPAFSVGSVVSRSFSAWFGNFVPFSIVALVVNVPVLALVAWVPGDSRDWELGIRVLSGLADLVVTGALTFGVLESLRGGRVRTGELFRKGFAKMGTVFTVSFRTGMWFILGLILLVVPFVVWYCALFVAVPAAVVEEGVGSSGDALARSRALTAGHRWAIFAVALVVLVVNVVLDGIAGIVLALVGQALPIGIQSLSVASVMTVVSALGACAHAVAYHDLRVAKEGVATADLVKVFE
ncbi:MAG TPA: hypothetical protein VFK90_17500 [Anaeromyxobacter sp.]|nr:hypothetical protein [Anaeromyxobacter sp.]